MQQFPCSLIVALIMANVLLITGQYDALEGEPQSTRHNESDHAVHVVGEHIDHTKQLDSIGQPSLDLEYRLQTEVLSSNIRNFLSKVRRTRRARKGQNPRPESKGTSGPKPTLEPASRRSPTQRIKPTARSTNPPNQEAVEKRLKEVLTGGGASIAEMAFSAVVDNLISNRGQLAFDRLLHADDQVIEAVLREYADEGVTGNFEPLPSIADQSSAVSLAVMPSVLLASALIIIM